MSTWIVSGAGDTSYNGTYTESGTYNSQPAYTNGGRWLYFDSVWRLSATEGGVGPDHVYSGDATLPGTGWIPLFGGVSPAPTLEDASAILPPGWNFDAWLDDGGGDGGFDPYAHFAPCRASIGGVSYIVLPSVNEAGAHLRLYNEATHEYSTCALPAAISGDRAQTAAVFDGGDGTLYVCSGVMVVT